MPLKKSKDYWLERQQRLHISDVVESFVSVTDVKHYIYCPRLVYFDRVLHATPVFGSQQEEGKVSHEDYVALELRRKDAVYYSPEFVGAEKLLFSTLCSGTLGLQGNVDLIIKTAKSRKARYCCPAHRVEYFRRRKRQEKKRIEKAHSVWLFRRDLQLRLEHLQGLQERTSAAITEIQTQLAALPTEGEIQA